ncbi:MAG: HD domain-containing protein [Gammaproteobacteria bacterium]|nr:HD domain-containing protein [Gammaproteobacteria bacterium]
MDLDPGQPDAYSKHLAEVNEHSGVTANADIYNAGGMLLVAKGGAITARIAAQIARHKLVRPLTDVVDVEGMLNPSRLLLDLGQVLALSPALDVLHTASVQAAWNCHLPALFGHRALVQKLTVLSRQLPHVYHKALLGAWFYTVLATAMRCPPPLLGDGLLAALLRDIGYLHLDPDMLRRHEVEDGAGWTPGEWRALQSHPVIARTILVDSPGLSPAIAQAVLEHHERLDGSGYPLHLAGDKISPLGRLLGFADALQAQWLLRLAPYHAGLGGFKPLLQSGMLEFPDSAQQAALRLLAQHSPPPARRHSDAQIPEYVEELLQRQAQLRACFEAMQVLLTQPGLPPRLFLLMQRIAACCNRSGLLSLELERWCRHVQAERLAFAYDEMEEVGILLGELEWQYRRLGRELDLGFEANDGELPGVAPLKDCLHAMPGVSHAELFTDLAMPRVGVLRALAVNH